MDYFLPTSFKSDSMKKKDTPTNEQANGYLNHLYNTNDLDLNNTHIDTDSDNDINNDTILGEPLSEIKSLLSTPINKNTKQRPYTIKYV